MTPGRLIGLGVVLVAALGMAAGAALSGGEDKGGDSSNGPARTADEKAKKSGLDPAVKTQAAQLDKLLDDSNNSRTTVVTFGREHQVLQEARPGSQRSAGRGRTAQRSGRPPRQAGDRQDPQRREADVRPDPCLEVVRRRRRPLCDLGRTRRRAQEGLQEGQGPGHRAHRLGQPRQRRGDHRQEGGGRAVESDGQGVRPEGTAVRPAVRPPSAEMTLLQRFPAHVRCRPMPGRLVRAPGRAAGQGSENSSRRGRRSSTMGGMPLNDMPWWRWRSNVRSALHMLSDPVFQQECWLAGRRRVRRRHRRRLPPGRGHLAGQLVRREVRRHDLPRLPGGRARRRRRAAGAADHAPGRRGRPGRPRTWSTTAGRRPYGRRATRMYGWPRTTARTRTRRRARWTCCAIMTRSA